MESYGMMRSAQNNHIKCKIFAAFYSFMFGRKIKMDFVIFAVFAVLSNYCFIDGCRSKEASVKISVNSDIGESSKKLKILESKEPTISTFESTSSSTGPLYQVPVIYPYSYPVPGVYYSNSNYPNTEYERATEIFQSQFNEFIQTPQTQPVPTQVASQPQLPIPIVPSTASIQTERNQEILPQTNQHQNSQNNRYNFPTISTNPVATQLDKRQGIPTDSGLFVENVPQNDGSYYQSGFGGSSPSSQYNPCQNKYCRPGSRCVVRRNPNCPRCPLIPVCVDPCETVRCSSGYVCKSEVGQCGTSFCEPRAICKDLCQGIRCPGNDTCSLVSLPCTTSCDPVPICGRDPCETTICPLGQGCYLQEHFCSRPPCKVDAVCKDPCRNIICPPSEFCYTEDVTCIKAPCNPIPVCKNPCAALSCPFGQQCVLEPAFCIRTPCNPIATCKAI